MIARLIHISLFNKPLGRYVEHHNKYGNNIIKHDNVAIVTYSSGDSNHYLRKNTLSISAHDQGFDRILEYSPRDIDEGFYKENAHILNQERGAGYWLWKPYIILDAMKRMPEDSIIFYLDGDCLIMKDVTHFIELAKKHNRVVFDNSHKNRSRLKRDAYILMDADKDEFYDATQLEAGFLILKNNQVNRDFVSKWLEYCKDERVLTDMPSTLGIELPEFEDHRHEQAILTLLALKDEPNQVHAKRKYFIESIRGAGGNDSTYYKLYNGISSGSVKKLQSD